MTKTVSIRQLGEDDLPLFAKLRRMFGEAFEDVPTYTEHAPSDEYVRSLLRKPHFIALVALDGDDVVGGLAAYVLEKFESERSEVYIYDLAVRATHRRQRIATRLIESLEPIAKARGAWVIFVQADLVDVPAIRLYESLGKREDVLHFDIVVRERP